MEKIYSKIKMIVENKWIKQFKYLKVLHIDKDKIVLYDSKTKIKMAFLLESLFGENMDQITNEIKKFKEESDIYKCKTGKIITKYKNSKAYNITTNNVIEKSILSGILSFDNNTCMDCIKPEDCEYEILTGEEEDKFRLDHIINERRIEECFCDADLTKNNNKLNLFKNTGFKIGNYVEFFLDFNLLNIEDRNRDNVSHLNTFNMYEFSVGEVDVKIGDPSDIFRVLLKNLEHDKYFGDWEEHTTISLKGINKDNYNEILQQALFLLGHCNPSVYQNIDYPRICPFYGYYDLGGIDEDELDNRRLIWGEQYDLNKFNELKYGEVITFYNAGMNIEGEEIAFLYFYKVLEYFFILNKRVSIKEKIEEYNTNKKIDDFICDITKYYKESEDILLSNLLESIENDINHIISKAKELGKINVTECKEFANKLYLYRNSIVHGKGDYKYSLKVPNDLENDDKNFWNNAMKEIAFIIISKYCFNN